jgi:cytochrome b561
VKGNTKERWGSVSIGLHWAIALLILLVQLPAGWAMEAVGRGALQNALYNVHKTTGITILLLAVIRLGWRRAHPVPSLPADLPGWQSAAARSTHVLLYLLLFLMPVSGFLYTAMGGFPVPYFGLYDLANLVPENKPLSEVFKSTHLTLQYVLYLVVLLHVGGALQHHFVRRDGVLRRMWSPDAPLEPEGRRS